MPPVVKKCKEIDCIRTGMPPVVKTCKEIDCIRTGMPPVVKKCKEYVKFDSMCQFGPGPGPSGKKAWARVGRSLGQPTL